MKTTTIVDKTTELSNDRNAPFHWHELTSDEAMLAYQLHLTANADSPPGLVRADNLAHFVANIQDQGRILGCFVSDKEMVAYGILGLAPENNRKIAQLLGLSEADLPHFASLDSAAALAQWRGKRLHSESILQRLTIARAQHRKYIGATVSPDNINSLRGLLEAGFHIKNFAYLYGELARLVMLLDLDAPRTSWTLTDAVIVSDHTAHQATIANGARGYALTETRLGVYQMLYGVQHVI